MPDQFVIARQVASTSWGRGADYELFVVSPTPNGRLIEKIAITPNECIDPANLEYDSVLVSGSAVDILGSKDPSAISERAVTRETKRREREGLSAIGVVMQVQCENQTRLIPSEALDKTMSRPVPNVPKHVSWTELLFERMDQALGKLVFDHVPPFLRIASRPDDESRLQILSAVESGKYDALFQGASDKPSNLYRLSQSVTAHRAVELVGSLAIQPEVFALPVYPQLARQANAWGSVSFKFEIGSDGVPAKLTIESGPAMLRETVMRTVAGWRFPKDASGQQIQAAIGFGLGCIKSPDRP